MLIMILVLLSGVLMTSEKEIVDFKSNNDNWRIINDGVMGGVSQSEFNINLNGIATFSGTVSPENNGGFASIRTILENTDIDDFDGVKIRIKGDGQIYNIRFRTDKNYDGVSYQAKIKSEKNNWMEYAIPFIDFVPTFRGRKVSNRPDLVSEDIRQVGILIADKQFGKFSLDIDWIKFYKEEKNEN